MHHGGSGRGGTGGAGVPTTGGCESWSFESGTTEGWSKDTDPSFPINGGAPNGATNFVVTTNQHHDGSYALAVPILVDVTNTFLGSTSVPLCGNGSPIDIGGLTMSAWVMVHNASGSLLGSSDFLWFSAWGPSGSDHEPVVFGNIPIDTWFEVQFTFVSATEADHIGIYIAPSATWSGMLYVDGVTLVGP